MKYYVERIKPVEQKSKTKQYQVSRVIEYPVVFHALAKAVYESSTCTPLSRASSICLIDIRFDEVEVVFSYQCVQLATKTIAAPKTES